CCPARFSCTVTDTVPPLAARMLKRPVLVIERSRRPAPVPRSATSLTVPRHSCGQEIVSRTRPWRCTCTVGIAMIPYTPGGSPNAPALLATASPTAAIATAAVVRRLRVDIEANVTLAPVLVARDVEVSTESG